MSIHKALLFVSTIIITFGASAAMASDGVAASGGNDLKALGATLALGMAALGGALAQGRTASAALEGIARNPAAQEKIFTPMIIGLALIESLVIYALIIAFLKVT